MLTPYDFAMEEVSLAILRLADALTALDPAAIEQECAEARWVYQDVVNLYPKLQMQAAERDSLLAQLSLLGSQLDLCDRQLRSIPNAASPV
ncbi:MAG: hypothetical protein EHM89_14780 [Acidobacteria bacterium]|nr:MAG: hypothetical protein EHM89_14780 [Acidobacteriota bacterium]